MVCGCRECAKEGARAFREGTDIIPTGSLRRIVLVFRRHAVKHYVE